MPSRPPPLSGTDGRGDDAVPESIALRATEWWVALSDPDVPPEHHAACLAWRREHEYHERAWQQLEAMAAQWQSLRQPRAAPLARRVLADASRAPSTRPGRRRALALLLTGAVVGGLAWQQRERGPWIAWRADHRTGTGERRQLVLEDGTVLDLNTSSAVALDFDAHVRRITLLEGEIAVATAPDPLATQRGHARPLLVRTVHGTLRPVGTRFVVRRYEARTVLAVLEGEVEIQPADAPSSTALVPAGQQADFDRHGTQPTSAAAPGIDAWRSGMLVAHDMRLADFVDELARHRRGYLACDAAVADLRLSGVFPLDRGDQVLRALPSLLPVRVRTMTRYWVMVEKAEAVGAG